MIIHECQKNFGNAAFENIDEKNIKAGKTSAAAKGWTLDEAIIVFLSLRKSKS